MTQYTNNEEFNVLLREIESRLVEAHGHVLSGDALCRALGYRTMGALRQAASLGKLPVPTFMPENRRGRYALTMDVAKWLAEERYKAVIDHEKSE